MGRVLLTGMSGTGKSTLLAELQRRGFRVVDTDEPGWSLWSDRDAGYVWDEARIAELLILREVREVEPLLRATCTHELDATRSVAALVEELIQIGRL